jgi:hypothetical protein
MVHDFVIVVEPVAGPCIPHLAYWTTDGDFVDGVELNTLSNTGTGGQFGAQYHDYTAMSTVLNTNSTYDVTITAGAYANDFYMAWIDYNDDGDWDDVDEYLGNTQIATPFGTGTINFTVPPQPLATKLMRVRARFSLSSLPCEDAGYGETEDYSVDIQGTVGVAGLNATGTQVIARTNAGAVELLAAAEWISSSYWIIDATGREVTNGNVNTPSTLIPMGTACAGAYTIMITGASGSNVLRFAWQ